MIFCINKNVKRLEVSLLSDRSACSPQNEHSSHLMVVITITFVIYGYLTCLRRSQHLTRHPHQKAAIVAVVVPPGGETRKRCFCLFWCSPKPPSKVAVCGDPETEQRSPSRRHSNICRTVRGQSPSGWTAARAGPPLRWTRVGRGGGWTLTLRVCLPLKSSFTCKLLSIKRAFLR